MSDPTHVTERDLSNAYLRLRALIPGAYDTPHAPTPEQVWETTESALRRVLQERDDARIRHPLTGETWVLDGRTGRTREVVPATDDVDRARREEMIEALREIADAMDSLNWFGPDGDHLLPALRAALRELEAGGVPATDGVERARREEREACARRIEARAIAIRDNGPVTSEGLLTALAGAQVGALLDAAVSLRAEDAP